MNMRVCEDRASTVADFVLDASFWMPEHNLPSAWTGHAPFAFWLMSVMKPRSVVELGVHHGFSYLVFCRAVKKIGIDCVCSGIDTWRGDEHAGLYGGEIYNIMLELNRPYVATSRLIRATFDEAQCQFADGSIDLCISTVATTTKTCAATSNFGSRNCRTALSCCFTIPTIPVSASARSGPN